jgi:hypothetical protein
MKLSKADCRRIRQRKREMRKLKRLETKYRFVDHPRYGDQPIRSSESYSLDEIRRSFWRYSESPYDRKIIFPETAIRAETHKQNYTCFPRWLYVDIARRCRKCGQWFIFFALEQKHWFETLGFYVDADCVHCQNCRHAEHELREMVRRYGALLAEADKGDEEWQELSRLGDALYAAGYIKKAETLLKTRRPKRMRK